MRLLIKWFPYATAWDDVSVGSLRVLWRLARQRNSVLSWGFLRDGRFQKQIFQGREVDGSVSSVTTVYPSHPVSPHPLVFIPCSSPSVPFLDCLGCLLAILEYDAKGIFKFICFYFFVVFWKGLKECTTMSWVSCNSGCTNAIKQKPFTEHAMPSYLGISLLWLQAA